MEHLSTEVEHLQEGLKKEEQASADLRVTLTSKEEKRREVEVNFAEEKKQVAKSMEEAISSFKSLEEQKNIKVAFTQAAFKKKFKLCQAKVVENFLKLDLDFLAGESFEDEVKLPTAKADLPDAVVELAESIPMPFDEPVSIEAIPSSSTAPLEV